MESNAVQVDADGDGCGVYASSDVFIPTPPGPGARNEADKLQDNNTAKEELHSGTERTVTSGVSRRRDEYEVGAEMIAISVMSSCARHLYPNPPGPGARDEIKDKYSRSA